MRKSLQLQTEMAEEFGVCIFDVTLDCEDGAPVGAEIEHAQMVRAFMQKAAPTMRVGVRVHAVSHVAFEQDIAIICQPAVRPLSYLMLPKVESVADVEFAVAAIKNTGAELPPLHVLIESPFAVRHAFEIAAHPAVQSLSFGLMDYVSAHRGAIPASGMGIMGQFTHPLVVRAKLEIAAACHAYGKIASHCVVTEYQNSDAIKSAAIRAAKEFGYSRMWSIHPSQIRPIIEAFSPDEAELAQAIEIISRAAQENWAPVSVAGVLHDRASFRYFWYVLELAHRVGKNLPQEVAIYFISHQNL